MALVGLRASVVKASPVEDHSTYQYHIRLQCGLASWEVAKRFSEFDTLLQSLSGTRLAGLPKLPAKTLLGSPTDQAAIDARKEQLRIILNDLLSRPDTRSCHQVRQFLALDDHLELGSVRPLQLEPTRTFEDARFGVSGICAAHRANLLLVTHEDSTHLSRLGRVWSVVEPDELGALHLWSQSNEGAWKRVYSHTFGIKARSLCWEDTTRQFFVGLEDGKIEVYSVPAESLQPTTKAVLELHHKSPVTHLTASRRKLLSLGFDTAMRVIDIRTRELLCGGRLLKRLRTEMDYLTAGCLDDDKDLAFIGTSGGDVFVYDVSKNPPVFLYSVEMSSKPVSALMFMRDHFLVAHGDCVTTLAFEGKGSEKRAAKLLSHRAKYLHVDEVTILSLTAAPERDLIFGGFSDGSVAVWTAKESEAFIVMRAHSSDVTQLVWLAHEPWGPVLFTGGGDGKVTMWSLRASEEDIIFWMPESLSQDPLDLDFSLPLAAPSDAVSSAAEPTWGGGSDVFRVENPRVNPQALRREDESDSEDDIIDAFR